MHEDYFLSNWIMEDGRGEEERKAKVDNGMKNKRSVKKKGRV